MTSQFSERPITLCVNVLRGIFCRSRPQRASPKAATSGSQVGRNRGPIDPVHGVSVQPRCAGAGNWPNFAPPHDAETALRAYDAQTLVRLVAVARTYDPDGVLQAGIYARADIC
jgi:hypothetical protein